MGAGFTKGVAQVQGWKLRDSFLSVYYLSAWYLDMESYYLVCWDRVMTTDFKEISSDVLPCEIS